MTIIILYLDIGQKIQRLRNDSKMTQNQAIAKISVIGLNISKSTYAKLETNLMNIRISKLVVLIIIFNTEFNDFFKDAIFV
ncbi:helix-turn-helix transcriptional regulator [Listeria booriae]|uniref:Helix-turn-helix transcriptional regulator n=1 Tax=Listeria booriae TaxID=1552123 RepID=A0A7X0TK32_9LIST|nr:helix-turn-helix transcriptional regulator [Listeria booriae]MBC1246445.1 helix-turn-helix transcriptional regulator [Listeria booriae]MBC1273156.1 helix-turn-helix transcriptional regulator [Listeria booriae]MBC1315436.1 helix-turn-helix transcriptional regulator [Listeria booriae]MBC1330593.1 helix-turn-helix transcriptional regulator [Listeria booriae]